MSQVLKKDSQDFTDIITSAESIPIQIEGRDLKGYGLQLKVNVDVPAAGDFTAEADNDTLTLAAHDFTTGLKVRVSNSGGALPTGLAAATDYYVVVVDDDNFKLSTSLANALAGTAIDLTDDGTGTQTVTPQAIAGASYQVEVSIDGLVWVAQAAATSITADVDVVIEDLDPAFCWIKPVYEITSGRMTINQRVVVLGE